MGKIEGPGPAKYKLPSPNVNRDEKPHFTMSKRTEPPGDEGSPGPAKYSTRRYNQYGKELELAFSMGRHDNELSKDRVPAPNAYGMPALMGKKRVVHAYKTGGPEFSLGARPDDDYNTGTPGANKYKLPPMIGKESAYVAKSKSPIYSISNRTDVPAESNSPGPAKYLPKKLDKRCQPTLKFRPDENYNSDAPAANKYGLQAFKPGRTAPAYTMGRRAPDWLDPMIVKDDN